MSDRDPVRLIESGGAPPDLIEALRSARAQAPSDASVESMVRGVLAGVGFPGIGSPGSPGGAPTGPPAAPGPALPGATSAGAKAALIKAGAVVAAGALAVAAVVVSQPEPESAPPPLATLPVEPPSIAPAPAPTEPTAEPEAIASAAPPAEPIAPRPAPPSETELLDAAQRALGGDPAMALRLCGDHARHHPGGALAQEREVIAIDALVRLGRRGEAEARAARFRQQHPGSGHLRRLDVLLGKSAAP
jgi:hypothetical protein